MATDSRSSHLNGRAWKSSPDDHAVVTLKNPGNLLGVSIRDQVHGIPPWSRRVVSWEHDTPGFARFVLRIYFQGFSVFVLFLIPRRGALKPVWFRLVRIRNRREKLRSIQSKDRLRVQRALCRFQGLYIAALAVS